MRRNDKEKDAYQETCSTIGRGKLWQGAQEYSFQKASCSCYSGATRMKCPTCGRRMPGTRDDMLDDIYFSLPIRHGDGFFVAESLGITHGTLRRGLKTLMAEGLVSQPRRGYYVEGNDED